MPGENVIKVSVQRKILLLLMEMSRFNDDFEVLETLSQKGMGRELGIRQNHVSRALSELKENGLVESRTAHIKDIGRRRKVYSLSGKGEAEMEGYISSIKNLRVPVRLTDSRIKVMSIKKLMHTMSVDPNNNPSYYDILVKRYDGSFVDLLSSGKDLSTGPPVSRYFFGRREEIDKLKGLLSEEGPLMMSVISLAGMGKTTLMGKVVFDHINNPVEWTSITEWTGPERLLSSWARHLASLGSSSLLDHINSGMWKDIDSTIGKLREDLKTAGSVFVLDDYHRSGNDLDMLMEQVLNNGLDLNCRILIGSRTRPGFYGKEDLMVSGNVGEVVLEGLDRESSFKILESQGISELDRDRIYRVTKGHPLALELAAHAFKKDPDGISYEMESYLGREMISNLNEKERKMLYLASAYEQPVEPGGLLLEEDLTRDVLESLKEKLLLRFFPDGRVDLHDLIKENTRHWMGERELERYGKMAVYYLSNRGSDRDILHYMMLLKRFKMTAEMDRLVLDMGTTLLDLDHELVMDHIRSMRNKDLKKMDRLRYLLLRADIDISEGMTGKARKRLDEALATSDLITPREKGREEVLDLVSRIYNLKAEISRTEGKNRDVIRNHLENVRRLEMEGSGPSLGKALNNLALAYKNAGKLKRAEECLKRASKIFEENDDNLSRAFVEANLSEICIMKNDLAGAREHLHVVENTRFRSDRMEARLRRKTGRSKMMMKDWRGALKDLEMAYDLNIGSGDKKGASSALIDMLDISIRRRKTEDARKAMVHFLRFLGSDGNIVDPDTAWRFLHHVRSLIGTGHGSQVEEAMSKTMKYLVRSEGEMKFVRNLGKMRDLNRDDPSVLRTLWTARKVLNRSRGYVIISLWLGEDLIDTGDLKRAYSLISKAKVEASSISFLKAVRKAEALLAEKRFKNK